MTRLLFGWELGANFGHVSKVSQIVKALGDNIDIVFAARDVVAARNFAPDLKARIVQAPYFPTRAAVQGEKPGQCYPGMLLQEGWDRADRLIPLVEAWRTLFDLIEPDILVAQAAPTMLLAAQGLEFKTVMVGSGYDAPPRAHPMPCVTPESREAVQQAAEEDTAVTATANTALTHFGAPELTAFQDLLRTDRYICIAFPQCDHYAPRAAIEPDHPPLLGHALSIQTGDDFEWRGSGGPKILAYLRPGTGHYAAGVKALARIGPDADVILAAPGIDPSLVSQLHARSVQVCDGPVRLDRLLADCALGVSHGSNGIGAAFLAHGVPQICLPTHREQMMFAQAIAKAGAGLGVAGQYQAEQVVEAIERALKSPSLAPKAREIQKQIKADGLDHPESAAAEILRDLISQG